MSKKIFFFLIRIWIKNLLRTSDPNRTRGNRRSYFATSHEDSDGYERLELSPLASYNMNVSASDGLNVFKNDHFPWAYKCKLSQRSENSQNKKRKKQNWCIQVGDS